MIDCYLISDGPPPCPLRPTPSLLTFIFVAAIAEAGEGANGSLDGEPAQVLDPTRLGDLKREIVHAYRWFELTGL
jgi:hypothetical protein